MIRYLQGQVRHAQLGVEFLGRVYFWSALTISSKSTWLESLSADDIAMYRFLSCLADQIQLLKDLFRLTKWTQRLEMVPRFRRKRYKRLHVESSGGGGRGGCCLRKMVKLCRNSTNVRNQVLGLRYLNTDALWRRQSISGFITLHLRLSPGTTTSTTCLASHI